ncbi:MAG TPA: RNA polymerase sigma factor, partial [Planctomycetota bacterium]|nr:RNA polymerase sigma factor [Planctomycetota bacterium]
LVWDQIIDGTIVREGGSSFRTFLIGIARNHCFMHLRAAKRRKRHEAAGAEQAVKDAPDQHTVPELADSPFVSDLVKKALASLPPEQSRALWMKYVEGMEYEAIAAETGVSVGTAKTRVRLAAEKLAKMGFGPG